MTFPSKGGPSTMHTDAAPGRVPVPCSACGATIGYVAGKIVERARMWTGASGKPITEYMRFVSDAGALKCTACERATPLGSKV